jgi:serine/threonine protein kinase
MIRPGPDNASPGTAEEQAAVAVSAFLDAQAAEPDTSPHRFAPADETANAEFWKAVEAFSIITEPTAGGTTQVTASTSTTPPDRTTDAHVIRTEAGNLTQHAIAGYEITRLINRGGQGVVYQAIQHRTKRLVAIKVLREGPHASKSARRRFEREIELAAALKHPNIVSIFHSGETAYGQQYYVMDYIRGAPLHRYVRDHQLSLTAALRLFVTVCEAVQYAHQRGVIHRDLKPSNIVVDDQGIPRVLDFGLAKPTGPMADLELSLSHDVVGTLPYMSPEQARGDMDELDIRTDIYSLGVVLYKLLTGTVPYPVSGPLPTVVQHICETPPTPPRKHWRLGHRGYFTPDRRMRVGESPIKHELQVIMLKTLAKHRDRRYQSAGELARDIENFLTNRPIQARRDSTLYLLSKTLSRHKQVLATVVVIAGLGVWFGIRENLRAERLSRLYEDRRIALRSERDVKQWALELHQQSSSQIARLQAAVYAAQLGQAQLAGLADRPQEQSAILAATAPELRHWAWSYLNENSFTQQPTPLGPTSIAALEWTPESARLTSFGAEGNILHIRPGHDPEILPRPAFPELTEPTAVAAVGNLLAFGEANGDVDVVMDNAFLNLWRLDHPVEAVAIGVDPQVVLAGSAGGELATLQYERPWQLKSAHLPEPVATVSLAPSGSVALVMDATGGLWRWPFAEAQPPKQLSQSNITATAAAMSPDGERLAVGGADGAILIYQLPTGELLLRIPPRPDAEPWRALAWDDAMSRLGGLDAAGTLHIWTTAGPPKPQQPAPASPLISTAP